MEAAIAELQRQTQLHEDCRRLGQKFRHERFQTLPVKQHGIAPPPSAALHAAAPPVVSRGRSLDMRYGEPSLYGEFRPSPPRQSGGEPLNDVVVDNYVPIDPWEAGPPPPREETLIGQRSLADFWSKMAQDQDRKAYQQGFSSARPAQPQTRNRNPNANPRNNRGLKTSRSTVAAPSGASGSTYDSLGARFYRMANNEPEPTTCVYGAAPMTTFELPTEGLEGLQRPTGRPGERGRGSAVVGTHQMRGTMLRGATSHGNRTRGAKHKVAVSAPGQPPTGARTSRPALTARGSI